MALDPHPLRSAFPALDRRRNGRPPIYLNNACTTLRPRAVVDAVRRYYEAFPTCGGGRLDGQDVLHHWFAEELREHERAARAKVAAFLGAAGPEEIVWTRNTTEGLNLVAQGLGFRPGDEVLTGENEHNSNLVPWLEVEARLRREAGDADLCLRVFFDLDADGGFDLETARQAVTPRTRLVSIAHASNLDGARVPDGAVRALADRVHEHGGWLLLDAAQSVPHRPIDVAALGVDLLVFSFHKMCGPSGLGVLWGRPEVLAALRPLLSGGDTVADVWQDRVVFKEGPARFEAGLQHYAGMLGAAAAIDVLEDIGLEAIHEHEMRLAARLLERLRPLEGEHFWILGPRDEARRSGIVTLASGLGGLVNAIERIADEESNVMLRKGMMCNNAYLHARFDRAGSAKNNLRASFYLYNTEAECDVYADVVERVVRDPLRYLDDA